MLLSRNDIKQIFLNAEVASYTLLFMCMSFNFVLAIGARISSSYVFIRLANKNETK